MEFRVIKNGKEYRVLYSGIDHQSISKHKWSISIGHNGRKTVRTKIDGKSKTLAQVILGEMSGITFFKDNDSLNNQRENLGIVPLNEYTEMDDHYVLKIFHRKYKSQEVFFDKEDFPLISSMKWSLKKQAIGDRFYAMCQYITMHRILMGHPKGAEVDHIDNNGLNNRRCNLRIGTHSQNGMNRNRQINNTSGYKGVYYFSKAQRLKKYWAYLWVDGKRYSGGYHLTAVDAAKKYNELALIHHKDFSVLNIIP